MEDKHRLRRRKDFSKTYKKGRSAAMGSVVLCYRKNGGSDYRVGFTVSKKVGGAVVRNRVRRRFKEIVRLHPAALTAGYDFIFIARASAAERSYHSLEREMLALLKKVKT